MTRGLTDKQQRILNFILQYISSNGYPPSIREIGNAFDISSLRGVTVHLDALERKHFISRKSTSRSICVIGKTGTGVSQDDVIMLPLLGSIAAGIPVLASENVEQMIPIPQEIVGNIQGAFVLRVKGESMIGDHIMPRDLVVIKPQATAENGDMVAVLLGEEATVKRIHFGNGRVRLLASNPAFEPIEINREDSHIIGKVVGLLRNYNSAIGF